MERQSYVLHACEACSHFKWNRKGYQCDLYDCYRSEKFELFDISGADKEDTEKLQMCFAYPVRRFAE